MFDTVYARSLVYNTCWEDPAVDRHALRLGPADRVLVITSAGCNTLDYALQGPARIDAVDANPRQTALLELKLAGIRRLEFDDYFRVFGDGYHPAFRDLYRGALRADLSDFARAYWDRNGDWFCRKNGHDSFYYFGLSGLVARAFRAYLRVRPKLRDAIEMAFDAGSLQAQREIYDRRIGPLLWSRAMNWTLSRQLTMSLLGVPHTQRKEVEQQHPGGVAGFIREAIEYIARDLPLASNYFWGLYLRGAYTRECCPEYLKRENFAALKTGRVDCIHAHTATVTEFLNRPGAPLSRFVLLDHMDWMSGHQPRALAEEWEAILRRACAGARAIFRSARTRPTYLDAVSVRHDGRSRPLRDLLRFHRALARRLSLQDRVHTYAGYHIADIEIA